MTGKLELRVKLKEVLIEQRAVWDSAYVSSLPDSAFAHVCSGGVKKAGITSPKSLRKLPYKSANGKVDLPHARNALARLNQVQCGGKVISKDLQARIRAKLQKALAQTKK